MLDFASTQTSLTMQFSLEPKHPTPILDHVLPFLGLQDTTCQVNEYILPLRSSENIATIYDLLKPRSLPRALDPMGRRPELNLPVPHADHRTSFIWSHVWVCSSAKPCRADVFFDRPQMNHVVHLELHLLSHVESIELLGRLYREFRSMRAEIAASS